MKRKLNVSKCYYTQYILLLEFFMSNRKKSKRMKITPYSYEIWKDVNKKITFVRTIVENLKFQTVLVIRGRTTYSVLECAVATI